MNSIESFSQNINAETFTTNAFNTFFIIIYNDAQTETKKTVMTKYHWRIIQSDDLFNSAEMIVRKHDDEEWINDYILSFK